MYKRFIGLVLVVVCSSYQLGITETLTIEQAIDSTLIKHPSVRRAQTLIDQVEGQRLIDMSPDPASLSFEYEGIERGQSMNRHEEKRISLSQDFEFPLKYIWRAKASGLEVRKGVMNAMAQILDLEKEVRDAFIAVWSTEEKRKIFEDNVRTTKEYARHLGRMAELGESAPLEARRINVELLLAVSALDALNMKRKGVWAAFKRLTGIETTGVELVSPAVLISASELNRYSEMSIENSPELQTAHLHTSLSEVETKSAMYGWLPDLKFTYSWQQVPDATLPDFWGIEVGISLPVWFWLEGRGELKSKQANYRASSANQLVLVLEKKSRLLILKQNLLALRDELKLYYEQVVPLAQEAYNISMRSFRLGEASYLEVLDAQRTLLDVKLEHLEKKVAILNVTSDIDRLTGRSLAGHDTILQILNQGNQK